MASMLGGEIRRLLSRSETGAADGRVETAIFSAPRSAGSASLICGLLRRGERLFTGRGGRRGDRGDGSNVVRRHDPTLRPVLSATCVQRAALDPDATTKERGHGSNGRSSPERRGPTGGSRSGPLRVAHQGRRSLNPVSPPGGGDPRRLRRREGDSEQDAGRGSEVDVGSALEGRGEPPRAAPRGRTSVGRGSGLGGAETRRSFNAPPWTPMRLRRSEGMGPTGGRRLKGDGRRAGAVRDR